MPFYRFPDDDGPDSPWPIFRRVLDYPELELQRTLTDDFDVKFAFVFRDDGDKGWNRGGKRILGTACMPAVTGSLSGLFDQLLEDAIGYAPTFLITINWTWWEEASDREREILVFHEAKHCGQAVDPYGIPKFRKSDGGPVLSMVSHDVEEFDAVVARYGAWKSDLVRFRDAFDAGPPPVPNSRVMDDALEALVRESLSGELDQLPLDEAIDALTPIKRDCDSAPQDESDEPLF